MPADFDYVVLIFKEDLHIVHVYKIMDHNPVVAAVEDDPAVMEPGKIVDQDLVSLTAVYNF